MLKLSRSSLTQALLSVFRLPVLSCVFVLSYHLAAVIVAASRAALRHLMEQPAKRQAISVKCAVPEGFTLVDEILETDLQFNELINWMSAASSVRLSRCSRALYERGARATLPDTSPNR